MAILGRGCCGFGGLALCGLSACSPPASAPRLVHAEGNPILADGNYYSADPAPLVADGRLYILAGRDEAPPDVNDFRIREWQLLVTEDTVHWEHYPALLRPEAVFAWASPGRAYAGQIVRGVNGGYYLYAPVQERDSLNANPFAIGVAVADTPLGPWRDAHPQGPIVSQAVPKPNHIENIDPTVLVDADGRVYMYWGTFGQLRAVEIAADMVTPIGPVHTVTTADGFFEAPWLFKRSDTYYLAYAANRAGRDSDCTPTLYHACIAYASAPSPLGPWTYRGVMLDPVSSTTSHPGIIEFNGQWYLLYHTADAAGGGHFRRSVAIDRLEWDDTLTPAGIRKVLPTRRPQPTPPPQRNLAPQAFASASNGPDIPLQYWIRALNDGLIRPAPLPPDMWASWTPDNPPQQWIQYSFDTPVTLNGSRIVFFADQPVGSGIGIAPPQEWLLQYRTDGRWQPVSPSDGDYARAPGEVVEVEFPALTTRCIRALFMASTDGRAHAALAVQEWEVLAPKAQVLAAPAGESAAQHCDDEVAG